MRYFRGLLGLATIPLLFLACEDPIQVESPQGIPAGEGATLEGTSRLPVASRTPDSATWTVGTRHGKALLACQDTLCSFSAKVGDVGATDSVNVEFWALGVRLWICPAMMTKDGTVRPLAALVRKESSVYQLLGLLDTLRKQDEVTFPRTRMGLLNAYALALLRKDTSVLGGYPRSWPMGIDTAGLVLRALRLSLMGQGSLEQLASTWGIGLTADQAKPFVLDMLRGAKGGVDDSLRLFPPSSLKFVNLVTLSGDLWPGGDTVKLGGKVSCDSGLSRASIQILRGDSVVTRWFAVDTAPSVTGTTWELDGKLTLSATSAAEKGQYTMAIQVWDRRQARILHTVPFKVGPRPDHEGPSISFVSPAQVDVIEPTDSARRIRITASDLSGIDSITLQGRRMKSSGDTFWVDVPTPAKTSMFIFLVTAWDRSGNRSDSILQLRRREVSDVPEFRLVLPATQTGNVLEVDSAVLRVRFFARSPYGLSDTALRVNRVLARRGAAPDDTDYWYQDVPVAATGQDVTIPVLLTDRRGQTSPHFIEVRRKLDTIGPRIRRITPMVDTLVDNATSLLEVRVEATDPSGVDSLRIDGRIPEKLGPGRYFALVPLKPSVAPTPIHVVAWDGQRNKTDSVIYATRSPTPAVLQLIQPARALGNQVAEWVDTFRVVWKLPRDSVKFKVESPTGDSVYSLGGGLWTTKVLLLRGKTRTIGIRIYDSISGTSAQDSVRVFRADALPVVVAAMSTRLDSLGGDTLGTRDSSVNLAWTLSGPCAGCTYEIDGNPVQPGKDKDSLLIGRKTPLRQGTDPHTLVVSKDGVVCLRKTILLRRYGAPRIQLVSPTTALQRKGGGSVEVAWKVAGATKVWIDGIDQGEGGEGVFRTGVTSPDGSPRTVRLVVADSGRGRDSATREIRWANPVTFHLDPLSAALEQWDSVSFTVTSVLTAGGVAPSYKWETDSSRKGTARNGGAISLLSTGAVKVCASLEGYLDSCTVSPEFTVRHTNQVPSYERPASQDSIAVDEDAPRGEMFFATILRKGGVWDSGQNLTWKVKSLGRSGFYKSGAEPAVDLSTGILSFVPAADSFGIDSLEVRLCDDGGTEHGGVDCSAPRKIKVIVRPVNDAPLAPKDWAVEVPLSRQPLRIGLSRLVSGPGEPDGKITYKVSPGSGLKFANIQIVRTGAADTLVVTPGLDAGVGSLVVAATDEPGAGVGGEAKTREFPLEITVNDGMQLGGIHYAFVWGANTTWFGKNLPGKSGSDTAELDEAKANCPAGWSSPDSAEWASVAADTAFQRKLGLKTGAPYWIRSPKNVLAIGTVPLPGQAIAFGAANPADKPKAFLRCTYLR